jgi:hypothetical protein
MTTIGGAMQKERINRILKPALIAVVAATFGAAVSHVVTVPTAIERRRLLRAGPNVTFKPPESPNCIVEQADDTNGDGEADMWTVLIRDSEPLRCGYILEDVDSDGTPDLWKLHVGQGHTVMGTRDTDEDGEQDALGMALQDYSNENEWYNYQDFNLDGKLDQMVHIRDGEPPAGYILMDDAWVRSGHCRERDGRGTAWIGVGTDSKVKVQFQDGEWRIVGEPQPLRPKETRD